ncbi:transposase [Streptomyces mirabilis]|uniref:transposase n=1 Tax=Streptomyces mirabilis TaxID=68239 RepID=UPI0038191A38
MESNAPSPACDCLAHRFANAADGPDRVPCYGSDLTEAEWQVIRPLLPVPAWLQGLGGRPEGYCHRVMLDAVRYVVDNGQCRCLRGARSSSPRHGDRRGAGSLTRTCIHGSGYPMKSGSGCSPSGSFLSWWTRC